ncbi:hypothetical protein [Methylocella sp.]|uniref:hypothetical protein n=1 Tax=Methylocella sp. TaxID=1978226 RepID=UPI003783A904
MKALATSFAAIFLGASFTLGASCAFGASAASAAGASANVAILPAPADDVTGAIAPDAADGVPVLDFSRSCALAFASREAAGACMSREEAALAQLRKQWAALPPRVRTLCVARVPRGVARAYSALADCAVKEGRLEKFRLMQSAR